LRVPAPDGAARAAATPGPSPSAPAEGGRARDGIDYGAIDYSRWTPTLRVVRSVCALLLRLVARIEVTGLANIPRSGPVVVAVNHLSMIDVVVLLTVLPRRGICFAADRLLKLPVVRWFLDLGDSIYVRRGEADREALERALAVLRAGGLLGVAPEGTRSRTGGLGRGRTGVVYLAASAAAPVVPVAAWGQEQIPRNLRRFRRAAVRVRIGTPLPVEAGDRTAAGLQHETDRVMEAIAAMLPPAYRGVYDDATDSTSLTPAS
jgi:1-acyl-sn-glycerol-3-phosphate acyltransferase